MKKVISLILVIGMISAVLAGCGTTNSNTSAPGVPTGLKGSIALSGSSALKPLADAAVEVLKPGNPDLAITVNAGGSGTGLQNVSDKTVDIGNSDVFAEEKLDAAKAATLVDHKVCVIGVACVVNPNVKVTSVTKDQLVKIFTGQITNWKDVGGEDMPIVIINRPASSGTRALFMKYALDGQEEATGQALQEDNNGVIKTTVEQTQGAVSYLALSYTVGNTVKTIAIDGVEPTYENIYSGKYPVWGYEHMYTNGEATGAAKSFIDFMTSDVFATNIEELGYGVSSKMKVSR